MTTKLDTRFDGYITNWVAAGFDSAHLLPILVAMARDIAILQDNSLVHVTAIHELRERIGALEKAAAKPPLTTFQKVERLYGETVESLRAVLDITETWPLMKRDIDDLRDVVQEALDRLGAGMEDEVQP